MLLFVFLAQSFLYSIALYDTIHHPLLERHVKFQVTKEDASQEITLITLALLQRVQQEKSQHKSGRKGEFWFSPFHFYLWNGVEDFKFPVCHKDKSVLFDIQNASWADLVSFVYLHYGYILYSPFYEKLNALSFSFLDKKDMSAEELIRGLSEQLASQGYELISEGYFIRVEEKGYDEKAYQTEYTRLVQLGKSLLEDRPTLISKKLDTASSDSLPETKVETITKQAVKSVKNFFGEAKEKEQLVSLNFYSADIDHVLQFFSDISGYAIIKNPDVIGQVTVMSIAEVSVQDAFSILKVALSARGFVLKQDDNARTILVTKRGDIARETTALMGESVQDFSMDQNTLVSKIIRLKYGNTNEIYQAISPMVSLSGSVVPYALTNTLIVNDTVANVKRLVEIIQELDQENDQVKTKIIAIKHADIFHVSSVLKEVAQQYRGQKKEYWVTEDQRTRSIFVTGYQEGIEKAESLITILDKSIPRIVCEVTFVRVPEVQTSVPLKFRLFSSLLENDSFDKAKEQSHVLDWKMADQSGDIFSWCGFSLHQTKKDYLHILRSFYGTDRVDVVSMPLLILNEREEFVLDLSGNEFFEPFSDTQSSSGAFKIYPSVTKDNRIHFDVHQKYLTPSGSFKEAFLQCIVMSQQTMVWGGCILERSSEEAVSSVDVEVSQDGLFKGVNNQTRLSVPPLVSHLPDYVNTGRYSYLVFVTPVVIFDQESLGAFLHNTEQKTTQENDVAQESRSLGRVDLGTLFPGGFELSVPIDDTLGKQVALSEEASLFLDVEQSSGMVSPSSSSSGLKLTSSSEIEQKTVSSVAHEMVEATAFDIDLPSRSGEQLQEQNATALEKKSLGEVPQQTSQVQGETPVLQDEKQIFLPEEALSPVYSQTPSESSSSIDGYVLKETLYRRGVTLYDQGKFREAIQEFAPLMTVDPNYKQVKEYIKLSQRQFQSQIVHRSKEIEEGPDISHLVEVDESMQEKFNRANSLQGHNEVYSDPVDMSLKRGVFQTKTLKIRASIVDVSQDHPLIILDKGEFEGMAEGMIFRVYRGDVFIGKVSLVDIDAHVSAARIISQESPDFKFQLNDKAILSEL